MYLGTRDNKGIIQPMTSGDDSCALAFALTIMAVHIAHIQHFGTYFVPLASKE